MAKHEKATVGDIILSVIIPGWGILIGLIALCKKEQKRGLTMIGIGGAVIVVLAILSSASG